MRPQAEETVGSVIEAIENASVRAGAIESMCWALFETTQTSSAVETDRDIINRLVDLISVMSDEIDFLKEELETAQHTALREQTATV